MDKLEQATLNLLRIIFSQHFTLDAGITAVCHTVSTPKELRIKMVILLWSFCEVKTINGKTFFICNLQLSITITLKYLVAKSPSKRHLRVSGGGGLCS